MSSPCLLWQAGCAPPGGLLQDKCLGATRRHALLKFNGRAAEPKGCRRATLRRAANFARGQIACGHGLMLMGAMSPAHRSFAPSQGIKSSIWLLRGKIG